MSLSTVFEAISDLTRGRPILVIDGVKQPAQGDLVCAADHVTPELVNFMARHAGRPGYRRTQRIGKPRWRAVV
jgi:3,4-dihydroxy 2-butanone 4-phosphate synthase/GTP cyclohydrolase II